MKKSKKWNIGTRGETMIEVVLSLAVVGITLLMITTMLGTASRIYVKNYKLETKFDNYVSALNRNEAELIVGTEKNLVFNYVPLSTEQYKPVEIQLKIAKAMPDSDIEFNLEKFYCDEN